MGRNVWVRSANVGDANRKRDQSHESEMCFLNTLSYVVLKFHLEDCNFCSPAHRVASHIQPEIKLRGAALASGDPPATSDA